MAESGQCFTRHHQKTIAKPTFPNVISNILN